MNTKTELRLIATATTITALLVTTLFSGSAQAAKSAGSSNGSSSSSATSTAAFLTSSFTGGQFIAGFTPGVADAGFTLDGLLQRKATGQKSAQLSKAIRYNLLNAEVVGSAESRTGYLYTSGTKALKPGLAGKFLFTSAALKAKNAPLRTGVVAELRSKISESGFISASNVSGIDHSWVVLGLATNRSLSMARAVAYRLTALQHADGGFGPNTDGDFTISGTDSTGLALQAFAIAKNNGSSKHNRMITKAIAKAVKYLNTSAAGTAKDHWDAWGDYDINGSAYAIMGLKAAGQNVSGYVAWLKTKVSSDGGLMVPWSAPAGDVWATAQGYVALRGSDYVSLVK